MDWKRLAVAMLVSSLGFVTAVTAAGGEQSERALPLPDGFEVRRPLPGDAGRYDVLHVLDGQGGPTLIGDVLPYMEFDYQAQSGVFDRNGTGRAALVETMRKATLDLNRDPEVTDWGFRSATTHFNDLATHNTFAWERDNPFQSVDAQRLESLLVSEESTSVEGTLRFRNYHDFSYRTSSSCLLEPRAHRVPMEAEGELFRWCSVDMPRVDPENAYGVTREQGAALPWPESWFVAENATFRLVAYTEWEGRTAVVFRQLDFGNSADAIGDEEVGPRVDVWFAHGVPVPVRLEQIEADHGVRRIIALAAFESGAPAPTPSGYPAPAFDVRPIQPWGPDESGWERFLPSEAWAFATEDGRFSAFLQAGARLHESYWFATEDEDEGHRIEGWVFRMDNGTLERSYVVEKTWRDPAYDVPYWLVDPGTTGVDQPLTLRMHEQPSRQDDPEPVTELPTMASVAARYQAFTGESVDVLRGNMNFIMDGSAAEGIWVQFLDSPRGAKLEGTEIVETEGWRTSWVRFDLDGAVESIIHSSQQTRTQLVGEPAQTPIAPAEASALPRDWQWSLPDRSYVAGFSLAAVLLGALYYFWPAMKGGVGMFSRITTAGALDHPVRRQIHDLVQAQPGVHTQAIVREIGSGYGNAQHHLDKLVDTGLIKRHDAAGYTCFFPKDTDRRVVQAAPALRSDTARNILGALRGQPGLSGAALATVLGVNRATVSHHLKRLAEVGLIDMRRDGRALRAWPTDVAAMMPT